MKSSIVPFPLALYQSGTGGEPFLYRMPANLRRTIGKATALRYQLIGFQRTANAQVTLVVFESPYEEMPADTIIPGNPPFHQSTPLLTLRSAPAQLNGPFGTNVELVLKCEASSGQAQESWQGLVAVTLFFEE